MKNNYKKKAVFHSINLNAGEFNQYLSKYFVDC